MLIWHANKCKSITNLGGKRGNFTRILDNLTQTFGRRTHSFNGKLTLGEICSEIFMQYRGNILKYFHVSCFMIHVVTIYSNIMHVFTDLMTRDQ